MASWKPTNTLDREKQAYLDAQLEEGERVLWASPTNAQVRIKRLWIIILASVFMMFFCSAATLSMKSPSRFQLALFSVLFWMALPAFVIWGQRDHLRRTIYAITDRRALILSLNKPKRTESYPPEKIEFIQPVVRKGGHGDLYFVMLGGRGAQDMEYPHGFLSIADVEKVAELMRVVFPASGS